MYGSEKRDANDKQLTDSYGNDLHDVKEKRDIAYEYITALKYYIISLLPKVPSADASYDREDMMQQAALAIIENMERYNSNISRPTTFFKPYIKANVRKCGLDGRITRYYDDCKIILNRTVRDKTGKFEDFWKSGIAEEKLSEWSGLSINTIDNTKKQCDTKIVSYDEIENFDIEDKMALDPETYVLNKECNEEYQKACEKLTSIERFIMDNNVVHKNFKQNEIAEYIRQNKDKYKDEVKGLKVTTEWIRMKRKNALNILRQEMQEYLLG